MIDRKLNRSEKIAVGECMELLARTVKGMKTKTDALLYFQFEDLINQAFGTSINHGNTGVIYEDGERVSSNFEIARDEYLETIKIIKYN